MKKTMGEKIGDVVIWFAMVFFTVIIIVGVLSMFGIKVWDVF
jgi:hypothetical protein